MKDLKATERKEKPQDRRKIRIAIISSSPVRRAGLEALLSPFDSLAIAGLFSSADALQQRVREISPEVVLLDISKDAEDLARYAVLLAVPSISVVALTEELNGAFLTALLRSGVSGLLFEDASASEIEAAIRSAARGLITLDVEAAEYLTDHLPVRSDDREQVEELTAREIEVLRLVSLGLGNKEIAQRLHISEHTVKFHISSILGKLGASTRTEAVTQGIKLGLVML